ncbi:PaaI family thioesterase [Amycolatopsis deserti]|uniref:PaaI family thioesterase n=1 Tax=Amycolatopsis deserti TaxID=185696 RepID=UPI00174EA48D|nr:acyl-CoA thioesterase domain-containing protein [Amycolatopsis deserti]
MDSRRNSPADWLLRALALSRATGAPVLACVAGLRHAASSPRSFTLGFASPPAPQRLGLVEIAMLADFALGGALRRRLGRTRPLPTLSLTLDLTGSPGAAGATLAEVGDIAVADDGIGTAAGVIRSENLVLGHCSAAFAVPSRGSQAELPWDSPDSATHPSVDLGELTPAERSLLTSARSAADTGRSWADQVISDATVDERGTTVLVPSEVMTNRAGAVQGGVLFAAAARCGAPTARLVSGTMRFLAGVSAAKPIVLEPTVEHTTRRTRFTHVRLRQDGSVCAVAGLVHRR